MRISDKARAIHMSKDGEAKEKPILHVFYRVVDQQRVYDIMPPLNLEDYDVIEHEYTMMETDQDDLEVTIVGGTQCMASKNRGHGDLHMRKIESPNDYAIKKPVSPIEAPEAPSEHAYKRTEKPVTDNIYQKLKTWRDS